MQTYELKTAEDRRIAFGIELNETAKKGRTIIVDEKTFEFLASGDSADVEKCLANWNA